MFIKKTIENCGSRTEPVKVCYAALTCYFFSSSPYFENRKFWNWKSRKTLNQANEEVAERVLELHGTIAEESWFDDDVTPQLFKDELNAGSGDITVWINSPGGDCVAAAQIYNMLTQYKGNVTVKIDGIAASAASVIAMAGNTVLMSPVSMMMIHNVRPDRAFLIAG